MLKSWKGWTHILLMAAIGLPLIYSSITQREDLHTGLTIFLNIYLMLFMSFNLKINLLEHFFKLEKSNNTVEQPNEITTRDVRAAYTFILIPIAVIVLQLL